MLRTSAVVITVVLFSTLLAGCARLFPAHRPTDEAQPTVDQIYRQHEAQTLSALLDFYRRTATMDQEELARRLHEQKKHIEANRCGEPRLRSAILISRLPAKDGATDVEKLLGPCLSDPFKRYSDKGGLAMALHELLLAQMRTQEQAGAINQLAETKKSLSEENAKLRKQLEGLKAIERSIQQRDKGAGGE